MEVIVRPFSDLRVAIGVKVLNMRLKEQSTVQDLLTDLGRQYGEEYMKKTGREFAVAIERFDVFVNRKQIDNRGHILKDGDEVVLVRPVGGG